MADGTLQERVPEPPGEDKATMRKPGASTPRCPAGPGGCGEPRRVSGRPLIPARWWAVHTTIWVIGVALLGGGTPVVAGLTAQADSLDLRVRALAADGRFGDALVVARELREVDRAAGADPYHLRWYDVWIDSLSDAANLPAEGRVEVARANDLEDEIRRLGAAGQYTMAEAVVREQLAIRRAWFGERHPEVSYSLVTAAHIQGGQGDPWKAEATAREALAILQESFGEAHFLSLSCLGLIAGYQSRQGDFAAAEETFRAVARLRRDRFGTTDPLLAATLQELGSVVRKRGDLARAEYLLKDSLRLNRTAEYAWIPNEASFRASQEVGLLRSLAELLHEKGDLVDAESVAREALRLRTSRLGPEHPFVADDQLVLAEILGARGDAPRADSLITVALELRRTVYEPDHPMIAEALVLLSAVRNAQGAFEDARRLALEARGILVARLGDDHPEVVEVDLMLARSAMEQGDVDEAERWAGRALSTEVGRSADEAWTALGDVYWMRGEFASADSVLRVAAVLYEEARLKAGSGLAQATFRSAPYARAALVRSALNDAPGAWEAVERGHGRLLADLLLQAGERHGPDEMRPRFEELYRAYDQAERYLEALRTAVARDTTRVAHSRFAAAELAVFEAESRLLQFEREVAEAHPLSTGRPLALDRVCRALQADEAIVGWLEVEVGGRRVERRAYVVRADGGVTWFDLGNFDAFQAREERTVLRRALAQALHSLLGANDSREVDRLAAGVWRSYVRPLESALGGVRHLVVVSSGALAGIPVECLLDAEGNPLLERFSVTYVPSASVFAWLREEATGAASRRDGTSNAGRGSPDPAGAGPRRHALLVGDPPFRKEHLGPVTAQLSDTPVSISTLRSALAGNREALSLLPRLRWSRQEVASVAQLFEEPRVLLGENASEEALTGLARSGTLRQFDVVHLATHALVDVDRPERSSLIFSQLGLADPLQAAHADTVIFDGVITGRDIVRTWDLRADLVVLSACETGLGREVSGEGFVGLAHALFQAGARSVVASLWKVDDEATAFLMETFYERWLAGASKRDALEQAKQALRSHVDTEGVRRFRHPAYWASFVLMGDPR